LRKSKVTSPATTDGSNAPALTKARYSELPNFHQVNAELYRGAQPMAGGLQTLKEIGIKTIINLRHDAAQTRTEADEALRLGLRYYSVPMPDLRLPRDEIIQQVLGIINTRENHPVFVHCHHGNDRTGTIIACYRISRDGWTATKAREEAEKMGMSWAQLRMKRYIDKFSKRSQKS
jgi:tyrosine-protein phosphatase SIW14